MIKSFEENVKGSSYWNEFYEGLSEKEKEKVKGLAMMSLLSVFEWMHKNRQDNCPCSKCDADTFLNDTFPCRNQHIHDLRSIFSYWDFRMTEDEFKKTMGIGYDFIKDEWEDD